MSRNEWEKGTVVIPKAQWAVFKKNLRDGYAKAQAEDFGVAVKLYNAVKAKHAGKRGVDWRQAVLAEVAAEEATGPWRSSRRVYPFQTVTDYEVANQLAKCNQKSNRSQLRVPLKKEFCTVNGKTVSFNAGFEGSVDLFDAEHAVRWAVSENNHAVECARESFIGKMLFQQFGRVKWTRGSGGALFGNDEYTRDAGRESAGCGGSYITDAFGPLGEKQREHLNPCAYRTSRRTARAKTAGTSRR